MGQEMANEGLNAAAEAPVAVAVEEKPPVLTSDYFAGVEAAPVAGKELGAVWVPATKEEKKQAKQRSEYEKAKNRAAVKKSEQKARVAKLALEERKKLALASRVASPGQDAVVEWVFNNIDNLGALKEEAPSDGAWTLLQVARESMKDRQWFMKEVWVRFGMKASAEVGDEEMVDDRRKKFELLERMEALGKKGEEEW